MNFIKTLAQAALSQLSTPSGQQAAQSVLGMLTQQGQGNSAAGLQNLVGMFEKNGLGEIMQSWIGTGKNMPINASQIMQAFGQNNLQEMAQKMGLNSEQASTELTKILPDLINNLTPNGQIEKGIVGDLVQALMGKKAA